MGSVAGRLVGVLVAAVTLIGCSAGSPDAAPTTTPAPRIVDTVQLGPRAVAVRVLLPKRYAVEPTRTWPVLYLFHGFCDTNESWAEQTDIGELTKDAGVIVAMPFAAWQGSTPTG
jgi:poly(3-hydroxybutyrate) depolymerase